MKIDRIEDKKFQITITEKEALRLSDGTEIDFAASKTIVTHIGAFVLYYIIESSTFPHDIRPTLELEL